MTEDEELAQRLVEAKQQEPGKPRRRMADWSPTVELLTGILDRLGEVTQAIAALGGAKPRKIPRGPYPVTAMDLARNRHRQRKHEALAARVLRRRPPNAPT